MERNIPRIACLSASQHLHDLRPLTGKLNQYGRVFDDSSLASRIWYRTPISVEFTPLDFGRAEEWEHTTTNLLVRLLFFVAEPLAGRTEHMSISKNAAEWQHFMGAITDVPYGATPPVIHLGNAWVCHLIQDRLWDHELRLAKAKRSFTVLPNEAAETEVRRISSERLTISLPKGHTFE